MMMFDLDSTYAIALQRHEELRREADRFRLADELPPAHVPGLRSHLSRWLHTLANRLEPAAEPRITPAQLHAR